MNTNSHVYNYTASNNSNAIPSYPVHAQVHTNTIPSYPVHTQVHTTSVPTYTTNTVVYQDANAVQASHDHRVKRDVRVGAAVGLGVLAPITIPFLAAGALLHHAGKKKGQAQAYNGQI